MIIIAVSRGMKLRSNPFEIKYATQNKILHYWINSIEAEERTACEKIIARILPLVRYQIIGVKRLYQELSGRLIKLIIPKPFRR